MVPTATFKNRFPCIPQYRAFIEETKLCELEFSKIVWTVEFLKSYSFITDDTSDCKVGLNDKHSQWITLSCQINVLAVKTSPMLKSVEKLMLMGHFKNNVAEYISYSI